MKRLSVAFCFKGDSVARTKTKTAFVALSALAAAALAVEGGMIAYTETFNDRYEGFYPTRCVPVTSSNTSLIQRGLLNDRGDRVLVTAVAQDGDTVRGRTFIAYEQDLTRFGLSCSGRPARERAFSRACAFTTKGQYISDWVFPRVAPSGAYCAAATPAQSAAMTQAVQRSGVNTRFLPYMYKW